MPTWPIGVETTTILFGKGITVDGGMTSATLEVQIQFGGATKTAVWDGDGTPLYSFRVSAGATDGEIGSVTVPVVDQAGWLDDSQAEYKRWSYKLTEIPSYNGKAGTGRTKYVQPLSGQTVIDFDRIPDGGVGMPVSAPVVPVTSVVGFTGPVTAEQLAAAGIGGMTEEQNSELTAATEALGGRLSEDELKQQIVSATSVAAGYTDTVAKRMPRRGNTCVVVGDSNIENGGWTGTSSGSARPEAAWVWGMVLSDWRLNVVNNAGIGGETTTQILARYGTGVIAFRPAVVYLSAGTNDFGETGALAVTLAESKANILSMVRLNQSIGAQTILATIPPRDGRTGTENRTAALSLNEYMRYLAYSEDNVMLHDAYTYVADPTSIATADKWIVDYARTDGTHYRPLGAQAAGKVLADLIKANFPPVTRVGRNYYEVENLIRGQGQFFGAAAGAVPTGWTLASGSASYITGLVPRADGVPGSWLEIVVPAGGVFSISRDIQTAVAVGDTVQAGIEFEFTNLETLSGSANQFASFDLRFAPLYLSVQGMGHVAGSDFRHGNLARKGTLLTAPYKRASVDVGTVQPSLTIAGGGTYRFANATVRKLVS
jgi:lysophospholipase L1-like esterase